MSDLNSSRLSDEELERMKALVASEEKNRRGPKSADSESESKKDAPAKAEEAKFSNRQKLLKAPIWVWGIVSVALVFGAAFLYVRVIEPQILLSNAAQELQNGASVEPIVAQNSDFIAYTPDASQAGELPPGVNPKQLALAEGSEVSTPAKFTFASDLADEDSHQVDVYMDFYSQGSRDFIVQNETLFTQLVGSGDLVLNVYPVLKEESFSIYAPEALAEVFGTAPEQAWGFFIHVLKDSIELQGTESASYVADFVATRAQEEGATDVDSASIANATFLTWLYTTADDPRLSAGYLPPVIYVDDNELDQETWSINNTDEMLRYFLNLD